MFFVHEVLPTCLFLECHRDVEIKRHRMDALLAESLAAPQNDPLLLSQTTRCALLAVTASVRQRCRSPTSALSAHDRTHTNESRSDRRHARELCMASRALRSRSHVRAREILRASRPTVLQDQNVHYAYDCPPLSSTLQAHCLATTHAQMPVYTRGMVRTRHCEVSDA